MNHYEENNEFENTRNEDQTYAEHVSDLIQTYSSVFFELESTSRVFGPEHPTVRLMEDATESLDEEKLEAAQAAFDALPKQVLYRAHHPWIGCPPPSGIREKFRKFLIPELVGEAYGKDPMGCYLQIDAREDLYDCYGPADGDGHVVDPALVYDPRLSNWPVRVQILEGSDPMVVKDLLKKILHKLDQDWDELTNPDSYPSILPCDGRFGAW